MAISAMSYSDYRAITIRKNLYGEYIRVQKLLTKYEATLNEADEIQSKVEILRRKEIDDKELKEIIKKSEGFLAKSDGVKARHIELMNKLNQISEQYNGLSNQKLLFKNKLPGTINGKTNHSLQ